LKGGFKDLVLVMRFFDLNSPLERRN
jgi:hypothetical protein